MTRIGCRFLIIGLCLVSCRHVIDQADDTDSGSTDSDSPADSNSAPDADADTDGDSDADSDADADSDSATDTPTDTTTDSDSCHNLSVDDCAFLAWTLCPTLKTEEECAAESVCRAITGRPLDSDSACLEENQFAACGTAFRGCNAMSVAVLDPSGVCWLFSSGGYQCIPPEEDGWSPAPTDLYPSDHPCYDFFFESDSYETCGSPQ